MTLLTTRARNFVRPLSVGVKTGLVRRTSTRFPLTDAPLLVVAPHQDDETIGCGGLIARKRAAGVPVSVVFLTDGSRCFGPDYPDVPGLVARRREEVRGALGALGVSPEAAHFLDLPDGGLGDLDHAVREDAVCWLTGNIESGGIGEVCAPHARDRHTDHEAAFALTRDALARTGGRAVLLQYLIWHFWESPLLAPVPWDAMRDARCLTLPPEVRARKVRALRAYRSQHPLLPFGFWRAAARPWELFVPTDSREGGEA